MRLLSWNVNGRVGAACERQIERVVAEAPDVLALQEITLSSYPAWSRGLMGADYSVISTVDLVRLPYPEVKPPIVRKYFNVLATRGTVAGLSGLSFSDPEHARLSFPEKYIAARIHVANLELEVHNAHLPPGSSRGEIKVHAFRAIRARIDEPTDMPRVLCGDFNTPQAEDESGVTTWASAHRELRAEWEAAERGILEHPTLRDVYREVHPGGAAYPTSHFTRGTSRRYDHVLASPELSTMGCRYFTEWLADGLSDHAAIEADLNAAA